jgi:peptidoglycan/LPS O-acetylase OafA/YrhL
VSGTPTDPPRMAWLDGLRGVAATQVVLLHYASAFLPAIGLRDAKVVHFHWENAFIYTPLFLPFDGYSAVYIFFVLSGVALTYSFADTPYALPSSVIRRIIRLGLPMMGGILLGVGWFSLWPDVHIPASHLSGSVWLAVLGPDRITLATIAHQIGLEGLLSGYEEFSVLSSAIRKTLGLTSLFHSFVPPLWTLHVELVGSLLILALVALRQAIGRRLHLILCLMLIISLLSSMLFLFVVGHVAADWLRTPADRRSNLLLGAGLLALGILLCTTDPIPIVFRLSGWFPTPLVGRREPPILAQSMYGAAATFFGLACLPWLQLTLTQPLFQRLGKISFSLYLTHFPIVITVASAAFCLLSPKLPYFAIVLIVMTAGCLASLLMAFSFEFLVDRQAIRLSRLVFNKLRHVHQPDSASDRRPSTEQTTLLPGATSRHPD